MAREPTYHKLAWCASYAVRCAQVEHVDPGLEQLIYDQKWPVIRDMVSMLRVRPERWVSRAKRNGPVLAFGMQTPAILGVP